MIQPAVSNLEEETDIFLSQPTFAHDLSKENRDALIVSTTTIDGRWQMVSKYGDDIWLLTGATTNSSASRNKINFSTIPDCFRDSVKQVIYRYMRKGRRGSKRPRPSTLAKAFVEISYFLRYVESLNVSCLTKITPTICWQYIHASREKRMRGNKPPTPKTVYRRVMAVENVYLFSQYSTTPVPTHPWPDMSAHHLAGIRGKNDEARTPLIPDDIFVILFRQAWDIVHDAPRLLDLRDEMTRLANSGSDSKFLRRKRVASLGFQGTYMAFKTEVLKIRTACYIVIASLSGCRHHELGYLRVNAYYSTEDDDGEQYWWMRSISTKTSEGSTEWMIPNAAVDAIKVLERWAVPYQERLREEIAQLRAADSKNVRIGLAEEHLDALFVGMDGRKNNIVRTLSVQALNVNLREFIKELGLKWELASHQFRRKFANYCARSQFGDLRYLKEHFKHWSMDMTTGYALNESQEMALYLDIMEEVDGIKESVVSLWLDVDEPLTGGYGSSLVDWRSKGENITLFKNHATMIKSIAKSTSLRSNGHAWCTAGDIPCPGNNLEKTRCGAGCEHGVVGRPHSEFYQGLYVQQAELCNAEDIGPGGRLRAISDLTNCANILTKLGHKIDVRSDI